MDSDKLKDAPAFTSSTGDTVRVKVETTTMSGSELSTSPSTSSIPVVAVSGVSGSGPLELQIMALNDTKAGMQGIDVDKINHIIQETSRGSKFYEHKKKRQEVLDNRVKEMKAELVTMIESSRDLIPRTEKKVDLIAQGLKGSMDLSRVIVHLDMDAFYASVEMRDDPSLRDKPMAVGGMHMLCTSNYVARKFGIRAAMPGFIAKKLCPDVVIVPPNFTKYTKASKEVEEILVEYGRETLSMSMDEAYFDITDYLTERNTWASEGSQVTAEEVVQEIREKICQKTKLTASAGIAANGLLAKICGDIRKPNDQYSLERTIEAITTFMKSLPIRKVCGIGAVTEQMLKGLDIHNCGDLWDKRAIIHLLFKPATASFLLAVSLGLGNSFFFKESGASDDRKSMSLERTFSGTSDREFLKETCHELCTELEEDLQRKGVSAKTIGLKIKTVNFDTKTRVRSIAEYTSSAATIFEAAWAIYCSYENEIDGLKLRLLGVRVSNLNFKSDHAEQEGHETKQKTIDQMFAKMQDKSNLSKDHNCPFCDEKFRSMKDLDNHVEFCLQEEPEITIIDSNLESESQNRLQNVSDEVSIFTATAKSVHKEYQASTSKPKTVVSCPVCNIELEFKSEAEVETKMNVHLDECLNKATVKKLVRETNKSTSSNKRPFNDSFKMFGPNKKKKTDFNPIDSYFKPNV